MWDAQAQRPGSPQGRRRIPVGQGLSGWVAENRKPILNGNPSVESGYLNNPAVFSTLRSAISVPLQGTSNVIGVLSLYHESRDAYTTEQLPLRQSPAPTLSLAIDVAARAAALSEMNELDLPGAAATIHHLDAELTRCRRLNSPLAIISLVAGILGWTLMPFLGSLVAIVTGHMARKDIRQNPALDGDVMAVIGLVLGWVAVIGTVLAILAFVLFFGGLAWLGTR